MSRKTVEINCNYCERKWEENVPSQTRKGDRCPYCGIGHVEVETK